MRAISTNAIAWAFCASIPLGVVLCASATQYKPVSLSRNRSTNSNYQTKMRKIADLNKKGYSDWKIGHNLIAAEGNFRQSLTLAPERSDIWNSLAEVLEEQGKENEALEAYRHAVHPPSNTGSTMEYDPLVLVRYADLADKRGHAAEANSAYKQAALKATKRLSDFPVLTEQELLSPTQAKAYARLAAGMALTQRGDTEKALLALKEATRLKPSLGLAHYRKGLILERNGNKSEAIAAFKAAVLYRDAKTRAAAEKHTG
jgi:tetratricopeptide (TPR) repeat protein